MHIPSACADVTKEMFFPRRDMTLAPETIAIVIVMKPIRMNVRAKELARINEAGGRNIRIAIAMLAPMVVINSRVRRAPRSLNRPQKRLPSITPAALTLETELMTMGAVSYTHLTLPTN